MAFYPKGLRFETIRSGSLDMRGLSVRSGVKYRAFLKKNVAGKIVSAYASTYVTPEYSAYLYAIRMATRLTDEELQDYNLKLTVIFEFKPAVSNQKGYFKNMFYASAPDTDNVYKPVADGLFYNNTVEDSPYNTVKELGPIKAKDSRIVIHEVMKLNSDVDRISFNLERVIGGKIDEQ